MVKAVNPAKAVGYMTKTENSLRMAKIGIDQQAYDNAIMSAIHSAINALDALTTSYLNKRASGSHTDVLELIKGIFSSSEYNDMKKQFMSLIGKKNETEYQPDLMSQKDAQIAIKCAERILSKVKAKMN